MSDSHNGVQMAKSAPKSNDETEVLDLEATGEVGEDDLAAITTKNIQGMLVSPTDWTIGVLVDLLKRKKIDLQPKYQRRIAWTEQKMSRFIESLFLRLPVPQVVLAETAPGRFAVIDGKQRVNSIARFCLDTEKPLRLQKCEYLEQLDKLTYDEIERSEAFADALDAFQSHTVRTIVVKNWKTDDLLYLLFLRLNQNSVTLSPQELRRALFPGDFMNWLDDKTALSSQMNVIFASTPDFRMRDMEVATRHLGFQKYSGVYAGNMKAFLDHTTEHLSNAWPKNQKSLEADWKNYEAAIDFCKNAFGDNVFKLRINKKYQSAKNRAIMDIMTYYFAIPAVRTAAQPKKNKIKAAYESLIDSDRDFLTSLQSSTKTLEATRYRFAAWEQRLKKLLGNSVPTIKVGKTK